MLWTDRLLGRKPAPELEQKPEPEKKPDAKPDAPKRAPPAFGRDGQPKRTDAERMAFHVRRFTLAIAQNEKGPERKNALEAQLHYWRARYNAELLRLSADQGGAE
jgi:hypothetical protein